MLAFSLVDRPFEGLRDLDVRQSKKFLPAPDGSMLDYTCCVCCMISRETFAGLHVIGSVDYLIDYHFCIPLLCQLGDVMHDHRGVRADL